MTLSIARRGALWGDRTAIVDISEDRRYERAETVDLERTTYADLAELARLTARRLAATGVEAGDVVCTLTRNRVAPLAALFACRRLGATYAPISHRLTPKTVERPLEILEPTTVVYESAQRDLVRELPTAATTTFEDLADADVSSASLESDPEDDAGGEAGDAPLLALHGDEGTPVAAFSAVAVERNCIAAATTWGLGRGDRVPLFLPHSSHDGLLRVALPLLYVGGTLLLDRAFDPGDALAAIEAQRATALVGRAVEFRELVDRDGFPEALESIAWAVTGTAVDDETRDAYLENGVPLARAYGPLECPNALAVTPERVAAGANRADDGELVGRPVLDCDARLVADGAALEGAGEGRLQLSGPLLADGPANTAGTDDERAGDAADDRTVTFVDGWLDADERARRTEDGDYVLLGGPS